MTEPVTGSRLLRVLRGLAALLVVVAVVAGVPLLLIALGRVPHAIPSPTEVAQALRRRDNGQLVTVILAAGVWLCWVMFTVSVLAETFAAIRRTPIRILPGFSWCQRPAAALVATIVIGITALPLFAAFAGHGASAGAITGTHPRPTPRAASAAPGPSAQHEPAERQARRVPTGKTYVVQRRDTLWGIAARHLGNPLRFREIVTLNPGAIGPDNKISPGEVLQMPPDARGLATSSEPGHVESVVVKPGDSLWQLEQDASGHGENWTEAWAQNRGRVEPGGERFVDPNLIKPGWTLQIPVPGTAVEPPAHTPPNTPPPHTEPPPQRTPTRPPTQVPTTPAGNEDRSFATLGRTPSVPSTQRPGGSGVEAPVAAFTAGGATLLAGVSLAALIRYRRRQFRFRNPGRAVGETPPELLGMERALLSAGSAGMADVTRLDQALRSLSQTLARSEHGQLPDVVAACLAADRLELILATPALDPPAPWTADAARQVWSVSRDDVLPYDPTARDYHFAPYPTLASVGYTEDGQHWLLDLERIASISLRGDVTRCVDLARFMAAELAHNVWSEMLHVTLVGFGHEMAEINPDRVTYTEDVEHAVASLQRQLDAVSLARHATRTDVLTGRLRNVAGDAWAPTVVLVAPHLAGDTAALHRLLAAIRAQPGRTAIALVLAGDETQLDSTRWQLTIDSRGILRIPTLGLELLAHQIPENEAGQLSRMLAIAATIEDRPVPAAHGDRAWDEFADAGGALRLPADALDLTTAARLPAGDPVEFDGDESTADSQPTGPQWRPAPVLVSAGAADLPALRLAAPGPGADSVLPLPEQTYLDAAATTAADIRTLAPPVTDEVRRRVESADPDLEADLADWYDPNCPRPRVTLLGPIQVRASGPLPERNPRLSWNTEIVAYLAGPAAGHTVDVAHFGAALWPDDPDIAAKTKVRQAIATVRTWLGTDPQTGREYLPTSVTSDAVDAYQLQGALTDAELFRRLRLRGIARGSAGIDDLHRALQLVSGRPFDARRIGGYAWLADTPLDREYAAMIVDVAHLVATHHLGAEQPAEAVAAAQVALRAGSSEDAPLLDLVAACDALQQHAEADGWVKRIMANYDAEVEEDLPPRTAEILFRRQWLSNAS